MASGGAVAATTTTEEAAAVPPTTTTTTTTEVEEQRRRVLVAVDESEESIKALEWAVHNLFLPPGVSLCSDVIVLLHVQSHPQVLVGPVGPGFYVTPELLDSIRKNQDQISRKVLLRAKTLCDENHLETETMVALGDARDGICEAIDKLHPQYLVIGSHGYGAFKRTFLGSVSDYCAHHAKCPIIIVRKQAQANQKPSS